MSLTEVRDPERSRFRLLIGVSVTGSVAVAIAIQWLAFSRHGFSMSPDSASYLYAARSLGRGDGFVGPDGSHMLDFPPGYPAVLATTSEMLGIQLVSAARLIGVIAAAITVCCVAAIVARCVPRDHWWVASAAAMTVAAGPPLLEVADYTWSELLFLGLAMPTVVVLVWLPRPPIVASVAVGVLLAAGATVRTAGLLFSVAVVAVYLLRRQFAHGVLVAVLALTGPGLWAVHNKLVTGEATVERGPPEAGLLRIVATAARTAVEWFSPTRSSPAGYSIGLIVIAATVMAVVFSRRNWQQSPAIAVPVVLCGTITLTIAAATVVAVDPLTTRLLAPVYPLLVIVMFGSYPLISRRYAKLYLFVICLGSIAGLAQTLQYANSEGSGVLDRQLVAAACALPPEKIVSNLAAQLAWLCDRPVSWSPRTHLYESSRSLDELSPLRDSGNCVHIVWFNREGDRGYLVSLEDLESQLNPVITQTYSGGKILAARCSPAPR